jgi:Cyanate lyase C-terminal domain
LIGRLYDVVRLYGTTIKALIEEEFGDGIMSVNDLELDLVRQPDPNGDRVKIVMTGGCCTAPRTIGIAAGSLRLTSTVNAPDRDNSDSSLCHHHTRSLLDGEHLVVDPLRRPPLHEMSDGGHS